jgi:phage pi2 protein 07
MVDKRKHYVMEKHYCYSDFDFYKNQEGTTEVGRVLYKELTSKAGVDIWAVVDTYKMKGKWDSHTILVLQRLKDGLQIETGGYGWASVRTEHELALKEKTQYSNFYAALTECGKLCPNGASRWFNDVLEMFGNEFEETLYYGEEDGS